MVHSLCHTSNRPLVIPFMSAAVRPCYKPHRHQSSRLTTAVIVFVAVLFLVGRSGGAELELGPRTLLLLLLPPDPAVSEAPVSGSVRWWWCRSGAACGNVNGRCVGDQRLPSPSHHRATKITIITWTVCQVTSLPPLPSSLQRESAGPQISQVF